MVTVEALYVSSPIKSTLRVLFPTGMSTTMFIVPVAPVLVFMIVPFGSVTVIGALLITLPKRLYIQLLEKYICGGKNNE